MVKFFKNKRKINILVLVMTITLLLMPMAVYAAFTQLAKINGDGVRLRQTPENGTILELMYKDELVLIDPEVQVPSGYPASWVYIKRLKTGTIGWMEDSYYVHDWDGN